MYSLRLKSLGHLLYVITKEIILKRNSKNHAWKANRRIQMEFWKLKDTWLIQKMEEKER